MDIRIIVAGSRTFTDKNLLNKELDSLIAKADPEGKGNISILSGGCKGANELGEKYANEHGYPVIRFIPDPQSYGRGAGPIRNEDMAEYAAQTNGYCIAFWDNKSAGTRNMISAARNNGLIVSVISTKGEKR